MLEKIGKNNKTICGSLLAQLYFILALYAFLDLYAATSIIACSPENEDSPTDNCKCYFNSLLCEYNDYYCASATYTSALPRNEDNYEIDNVNEEYYRVTFTIKCNEQTDDITQFFDALPLRVKSMFNISDKFFYENISYSATLKYARNTDTVVLSHPQNLHTLLVIIGSYANDEKWLSELLRPLTALKKLMLELYKRQSSIILPTYSFITLNELLELTLNVLDIEQLLMSKLELRNLTNAHFRNLTKLKHLNLNFNHMQTLEPRLFSALHELLSLKLNNNNLRNLPTDLFAAQSKLILLDLSENQLEYLPTHLFARTARLSKLELQSNNLHDMGNMLATLKPLNHLTVLDLSKNEFESITHTNQNILTHINLKSYSNTFNETPKLDLSHNNLINFTWDDKAACNLEIVLSYNRISNIQALTLPTAVTPTCTRFLDLRKNPFHCDCQLVWFYYLYFLPASTIRTDTTTWVCDSPWKFAGRFLRTLQLEDVCERSATFCPAMCNCTRAYGEDGSSALVINCTGVYIDTATTQLPHSHKASQTTLYIERCKLTELPLNLINSYANVTRLYAAENNITTLTASHLPSTLLLLDLRANNLKRLSGDFLNFLNQSTHLQALHLSHNPWLCDCEVMQLVYTLRTQRALIPYIDRLACADRSTLALLRVDPNDICRPSGTIVLVVLALSLFAVMLLILTALYYKYSIEVKVWLYAHKWCVFWISEEELDQNKTFDAFISYAHQQSQYISEVLLPGLEQGQPPFRICVHDRNWLAGECIPDQIVRSVEQSRRTIFVLSQDFIKSNWARLEFRIAHQCALNEGRTRVIIIKYDDLLNLEYLDQELQTYMKTNTYLESNDPRFWEKLRYAMPHKKGKGRQPIKFYIPDEMELCT